MFKKELLIHEEAKRVFGKLTLNVLTLFQNGRCKMNYPALICVFVDTYAVYVQLLCYIIIFFFGHFMGIKFSEDFYAYL